MSTRTNIQTPSDIDFDYQLKAEKKARASTLRALDRCILITAKKLVSAGGFFTRSNPELLELERQINNGIISKDIHAILSPINDYLSTIATSLLDFQNPTPETHYYYALMCLTDCFNHWASFELEAAHADTVRCRASLNKIE